MSNAKKNTKKNTPVKETKKAKLAKAEAHVSHNYKEVVIPSKKELIAKYQKKGQTLKNAVKSANAETKKLLAKHQTVLCDNIKKAIDDPNMIVSRHTVTKYGILHNMKHKIAS